MCVRVMGAVHIYVSTPLENGIVCTVIFFLFLHLLEALLILHGPIFLCEFGEASSLTFKIYNASYITGKQLVFCISEMRRL